MFKVAILGCENSHADNFLKIVIADKKYPDVDVIGVYSHDNTAAAALNEKYGVYVAKDPNEFVGKIDGLIITARHGAKHLPYAMPYIASGIPMFIDKPITISREDAKTFKALLAENKNRISGGSSCVHSPVVKELAQGVKNGEYGKITGGFVRAPLYSDSEHGGLYFYAQHGIQIMTAIYGNDVISVDAKRIGDSVNADFNYKDFTVNILFSEHGSAYFASVAGERRTPCGELDIGESVFEEEFRKFHALLLGGESYSALDDFFAPVYIINALDKSLDNGREEKVEWEN